MSVYPSETHDLYQRLEIERLESNLEAITEEGFEIGDAEYNKKLMRLLNLHIYYK